GVRAQDVAARLLDDVDDAARAPGPGDQQSGAARRAVDVVERALLVAARRTLLPDRERVVTDHGDAVVKDGRGVRAEPAQHDDGGEGAGAAGQLDPGREAGAGAVVGDVHRDVVAADRPGDVLRLRGLL